MNGLILKDVSKVYENNGNKKLVLDKVNLDLDPFSKNVLIGKSGCGKTTLLKAIADLIQISDGKITKDDELKFSYVFQNPRLFPWKNVRENIEFSQKDRIDKVLVDFWIKTVKLEGYESFYPSQLSGGMQARVALARAMVCKKNFILLDEPFSALDYFTRSLLQDDFLEIIKESHLGFLFVTHSIDEALKLADNIYIMNKGKIIRKINLKKEIVSIEELKEYFFSL